MNKRLAHLSVMAEVAPPLVVTDPNGTYVDATFGRGGHTRKILSLLSDQGRLFAFDRDPEAVVAASEINDERFRIIHAPFSRLKEELNARGVDQVNGVFMDIGVSSPQIDDASRGFSFRMDGPLDMRMDTTSGQTAAEWLAVASEEDIARVIHTLGEERFAKRIAHSIVQTRVQTPIETTQQLAKLVADVVPANKKDPTQNPATRTFQAIRIHINSELDELAQALNASMDLVVDGGRIAVITFHSLEDRIVKRFFDEKAHPEKGIDSRLPLRADELPRAQLTEVKRVLPTPQECDANPRARSAILRLATRVRAGRSS
ncbi:MAG TPA: 16S rRNA (cytosine(1402)-N(4))-methyltransferase RsmH [Candidatus Aphodousia faecigallinarum]|uniref:Ribosomal RNA small subunit methyltransferase H n=1 Tax=Candidatus Aphodousia faecigallinarum TaxID=2840677 RepID=A0A9D1III6_9BURK|nr:16S rRNA (cytosine(1402)-N(4))-methyltransferase RsmH [Candidatus Aphodousia faecigallinarum]